MKRTWTIVMAVLMSGMMMAGAEYELVWNEDFTDGALDSKAWNIEVNGDGGGNNELQYYRQENVSIEANPYDGKQCLVLTARVEDYKGKKCTSGRVTTQNKVTYTYGKIEARIKFPETANGLWPAFWQMGNDISKVGWPRCGETDFIEMGHQNGIKKNTQDRYFNGAMHLGSAWNTVWQDAQSNTWQYSLQDTFHIITVEWTPTSMTMWMDRESHPENKPYFTTPLEPNEDANYDRSKVFGKPNFLLLNLAIGGNFPGISDISKVTALSGGERKMYIDWVRVYQLAGETNLSTEAASDAIEEADPNWKPEQGVEQIPTETTVRKQIHNGRLVIVRGETQYDVLGNKQ